MKHIRRISRERFEKNDKIQGQSSNFKVKYIFFLNRATNKCNTSILSNFVTEKIFFGYYFNDSSSSSRSKCQFQGQIVQNVIFNKHN